MLLDVNESAWSSCMLLKRYPSKLQGMYPG